MRLPIISCTATVLLLAGTASAQTAPSAPVAQWGWGIRVGVGPGSNPYGNSRRDYPNNFIGFVGGPQASRYLSGLKASIGLEALLAIQNVRVDYQQAIPFPIYRPQTLTQWRLFMPLYLRTGTPASRAHLLVGAGPTLRLGTPASDAAYYPNRAELTMLLGAEVRLLPWHRYETTLGLRFHVPLTPSYAYGSPSAYINSSNTGPAESRSQGFTRWFGVSMATTFYPAASK